MLSGVDTTQAQNVKVDMKTIFAKRLISVKNYWWIYFCLLVCIHLSNGSDETLEIQYTVHHDQNHKPQFQQTTLFNGNIIFSCNKKPTMAETSQDRELRDLPRQNWVIDAFTQEELQDRHKQCKTQCYDHFAWLEKIQTITVTEEVLQRRQGCIINSLGAFSFDKWGVNGEDFLNFDPKTLKWTALSDKANHLATDLNGMNIMNHAYRHFDQILHNTMFKVKKAARSCDDPQTGMELHIFAKHSPGRTVTYLQCHVTGLELSGVRIQLTKDGVPLTSGLKFTGPRPNGDGTVQMRVQIETILDNSKTYRCEAHSKTVNMSVLFDDPSSHMDTATKIALWVVIAIICIAVLCVSCWIFWSCWWWWLPQRSGLISPY